MKYRTVFRPEAREDVRRLPRSVAMTILRNLTELENDPYEYDTTALVSRPDVRRLRVGDYRVFYTIENGELVVYVVAVAHRGEAYR